MENIIQKIWHNFMRKNYQSVKFNNLSTIPKINNTHYANHNYFVNNIVNNNPIVNRCIQLISENLASVPIKICRLSDNVEIINHKSMKLINKPNDYQNRISFLEEIACQLITGNAIVEISRSEDDNTPCELHVIDADNVKISFNYRNFPEEYEYKLGNKIRKIDKKNACYISGGNFFEKNKSNFMNTIHQAACIYHEVIEHNTHTLKNSVKLSGALMVKNTKLTEQQRQELRNTINTMYKKNPGEVMILEGDFEWIPMHSKVDFNYAEAINTSYKLIAMAFGVPVQMLGVEELTYANYREAKISFFTNKIIPMMQKILCAFNNSIIDEEHYFKIDDDFVKDSIAI
ncbi:phage portal protein [Candidatus Gromoviella agglomerans]|uniref:phage portal protein n=1 Tax=Candidatus Gromoviella agglomerans TaxID=2806609 RepID=UPI001E4545F2|nr:phage portal protein [Candidatus Gromoviella agglomerans]UFX98260.1 Phage portal protein [Candidatus Gromoviella agglomerans]